MNNRFWDMNLDKQDEISLILSTENLVGLVDETKGGIIGYINKDCIDDLLLLLNKEIEFTKSEKTIILGAVALLTNMDDSTDRTRLFYKVSEWCEE